jgi:magnesium chelatase family protein
VSKARDIQTRRFAGTSLHTNAQMKNRHIKKICKIDEPSSRLLQTAVEKLRLSARAYNRILKIARTIADLEGAINISAAHVSEAVIYRSLDRGVF